MNELARYAKLNPSVIYRIEDGRTKNPTDETLEKIAAALGVTVREIRNAVPIEPIQIASALIRKDKAGTQRSGEASAPTKKRRQVG